VIPSDDPGCRARNPAEPDRDRPPLTHHEAVAHVHGICFKTGPPERIGVELEWLVRDARDPRIPVDPARVTAALDGIGGPGVLPSGSRLTTEPGGQLELSSPPAAGIAECVTTVAKDMTAVLEAMRAAGLQLSGHGLDPLRPPLRVVNSPRYVAMEAFFDRSGPAGRIMMCSTASVQVCLDAGEDGSGPQSTSWRWQVLHAIGPVLVAAFANSPLREGRPTGWRSTRQAVWGQLDPGRTRPPPGAHAPSTCTDLRSRWADYALDAQLMCIRRRGDGSWVAPPGLTFRSWLREADRRSAEAAERQPAGRGPAERGPAERGSAERGPAGRRPTLDDLDYHLSTLFPPVRPRGHLELRVIDAQPGQGWIVPTAVAWALLSDPQAGDAALEATEPLWSGGGDPWLRAARDGPGDPAIARAARACFAAATSALRRRAAPASLIHAVDDFVERYVGRSRCPADDLLEEIA
jgi:ergothioneine biosynthesis glutamate--cysteine ligase EgtA